MSLGLHKESYNYFQKVQNINQVKSIAKLKQLYNSIESPRERRAESLLKTRNPMNNKSA
jgi:hypothetical protein